MQKQYLYLLLIHFLFSTTVLAGECEILSRSDPSIKIETVIFRVNDGVLCAFGNCRSAEYFSDHEGAVLVVTAIPLGRMTVYYIPEPSSRNKMDGWSQYTGNHSPNKLRNCKFSESELLILKSKRTSNFHEPY